MGNKMTAHLPNRGMQICCGGGSGVVSDTKKNETTAAASAISRGRGNRTATTSSRTSPGSTAGGGGSEPAAVSPHSGPPSACCISLVMDASASASVPHPPLDFAQAIEGPEGRAGASPQDNNGRGLSSFSSSPSSATAPPREHGRNARRLARPTSFMGEGYTGSAITPASTPQPSSSTQPVDADRSFPPVVSRSSFAAVAAGAGSIAGVGGGGGVTPSAAKTSLPPPVGASATGTPTSLTFSAATSGSDGDGPLPDAAILQSLLKVVAPHPLVDRELRVVLIPIDIPGQLNRKYELRISSPDLGDRLQPDRSLVVLVLAPTSTLRLLKSEKDSVEAEAAVLEWIRGEVPIKVSTSSEKRSRMKTTEICPSCCAARNEEHDWICDDVLPEFNDLSTCLPTVVEHASSTQRFGSAYNILSYPRGLSPLFIPRGLSTAERRHIHYRSGRLARQAALLASPSRRFGPILTVLSPNRLATRRRLSRGMEHQGGVDSWSLAFHTLLEGILRDAEDMAVTIPYKKIRWHYGRLRHYLDQVTVPRLVLLSATHEFAAVVGRSRHETKPPPSTDALFRQRDAHRPDNIFEGETKGRCLSGSQPQVPSVVGFCDWSNCIYGDPLMATVVGEEASCEFLRGFSGRQSAGQDYEEDGYGHELLSTYGDIVECPEHAHLRVLLYKCYHETVAIVAEFYRPRKDSTAREFEARKRLHAVLAELDAMGDDSKVFYSQPSEDMVSIVEPKVESGSGEEAALC